MLTKIRANRKNFTFLRLYPRKFALFPQPRYNMSNHMENSPDFPPIGDLAETEPSFWGETFRFVLIAIIIALPIRLFIMQPFIVSGESMADTFHNGDYLIIDELTYRFEAPQRGDVIVFKNPRNTSQYYIKRIIGLPGETIDVSGTAVKISGGTASSTTLSEPYIDHPSESISTETMKSTEYFVLGDNRGASSDSRIWGALPKNLIIGRAVLRLWPPSKIGVLPGKASY